MSLRQTALALILAAVPTLAPAQSAQDAIVAQLTEQGFRNISVSRTLLGRVRILAVSSDLRREIVFNPATGEIIRDYWEDLDDDDDRGGTTIFNPNAGSGSNDDDDDDSSGSGSGGTGGGNVSDDDDDGDDNSGSSDDRDDDRDDDRGDDRDDDDDRD